MKYPEIIFYSIIISVEGIKLDPEKSKISLRYLPTDVQQL